MRGGGKPSALALGYPNTELGLGGDSVGGRSVWDPAGPTATLCPQTSAFPPFAPSPPFCPFLFGFSQPNLGDGEKKKIKNAEFTDLAKFGTE